MGLTSTEAQERLKQYGPNTIPEAKASVFKKIVAWLVSPISLMLFAAAGLSYYSGKVFDGSFILSLLVLNMTVSLWQENKADRAIKQLNQKLSSTVKVKRDERWISLDSSQLVPGDTVELATGEICPADGKILTASNVAVDQSALTGESLPVDKKEGDTVYSGSFLTTGLAQLEITATGKRTYFGKTLVSVERVRKKSLLEEDVLRIARFLSISSVAAVLILSVVFLLQHTPVVDLLTLDLTLLVAGIPISLPTVMTLIIELGVIELAKKGVVIRRLSSLEDLSNVDFLLTDKTGTLTQNKITIGEIKLFGETGEKEAVALALSAAANADHDPIGQAIKQKAGEVAAPADIRTVSYTPADSIRKRATSIIERDGKKMVVSLGAPQIVTALCRLTEAEKSEVDREVEQIAKSGSRVIALAVKDDTEEEKDLNLVALFSLSDTIRPESPEVISFLNNQGIAVSMVTGDHRAIGEQIARAAGLRGENTLTKSQLDRDGIDGLTKDQFLNTSAFVEILPEDKFRLAERAKQFFTVAVNGDGVNDLPAVKSANVGIAVANAVAALKSAADIVLLTNGIGVIKDAIIESRKIFARVYFYSVYRISESFRLIVTTAILGILYKTYPITPLQIILLALLNDLPIISLAFDRVRLPNRPSQIPVKERFILSTLYGMVGVANSLILFFLMVAVWHLPWEFVQVMYFLKLTVSGHMLIFVAHTKKHWWQFLPSKEVMIATFTTQITASLLALTGLFMPGKLPLHFILLVWGWAFIWMQVSEIPKALVKDD